SIEDLYIEMEDYQKVISCIDEMDDKYRDVLRLKILHHLNSKETGKILNISEYNVNVRFMRAKAILARKLEERNKNE
uniref:RNA polymerase sigma factor n=4 Tax=Lachnospirales TaxID=3085636 RepID=UPI0025A63E5C